MDNVIGSYTFAINWLEARKKDLRATKKEMALAKLLGQSQRVVDEIENRIALGRIAVSECRECVKMLEG